MTSEQKYRFPGFEQNLTSQELALELSIFEQAVIDVRQDPPGKSAVVEACMEATLHDLHDDNFPEFRETVSTFLNDRPDLYPHIKVQLFWRVFQHSLLKDAGVTKYPTGFANVNAWQKAFRSILQASPKTINREGWEVQELLGTLEVQTNEPRRYAGLKIALDAYSNVMDSSPSYVDAGCSAGLGQIQIGENLPFRGMDIATRNSDIRHRIREGLKRQINFSKIVGFDKVVGTSIEWVDACSYPQELTDTARNRERRVYRDYLAIHRKYYKRLHGNLADGLPGVENILEENNGQQYDIASALTMLYEIPKDLQPTAIKTLENLAKTLIVVVDFAEINKDDPTTIKPASHVQAPDARYRLLIKDLTGDNGNWQHLGTFDNGRCTSFKPEKALLKRYVDLAL